MTIQGINTTAGTLTYSYENISIGPGATVTIPSSVLASFAQNPQALADITAGFLDLTDTVTIYKGFYAIQLLTSTSSERPTYSATASAFVPPTLATDIFTITGSATRTIRVKKVVVSGTTTSGSPVKITMHLIKRSAVNTGGTIVNGNEVPYDSDNAAATATTVHYTANPSALGTAVGTVASISTSVQASGLTQLVVWDFKDENPLILRGTSQVLAVNFNGTTVSGPIFSVFIEWTEV